MRYLLLFIVCTIASTAWAQVPSSSVATTTTSSPNVAQQKAPPPPKAPPGFEPLSGKKEAAERVDANVLVGLAYGAIFVLLIGYISFLIRARKRTLAEIELLQTQIDEEEKRE